MRDLIRALNETDPRRNRLSLVLTMLAVVVWTACVLYTSAYHEYWRDEVRPLSFAREAVSFLGIWDVVGEDGHPALWPVTLYLLDSVFHTNLVLGIASTAVAFLAIVLFLWKAPLPLWVKCLAVFSSVPLYEYAVMARNYGISMLLMFVVAWLHRRRDQNPLLLAFALALLANTNVHSACLAFVFVGIWSLHELQDRWSGRVSGFKPLLLVSMGIFLAGVALAAYTLWPSAQPDVLSQVSERVTEETNFAFGAILRFPGEQFFDILRPRIPLWQSVVLLLLCMGLFVDLATFVGAIVGILGLAFFFDIVSTGYYRHQALLIPFILSAYWIATDRAAAMDVGAWQGWQGWRNRLLRLGQLAFLPLLLVPLLKDSIDFIAEDVAEAWSSSKAFAAFLHEHPQYDDAILVGEPGYYLEALPYYVDRRMYLPREARFGTTVRWGKQQQTLTLGSLLDISQRLARCEGQTVLIVFGHPELAGTEQHEKEFSYGSIVAWSADERLSFLEQTSKVASFNTSIYERYDVFEVIAAGSIPAEGPCANQ